ncbi:MAG: hypothetical protein MJZ09_08775 [Bacteroidales bacterium]|nr:hypothetical protein [Bacteroidales bacterium]
MKALIIIASLILLAVAFRAVEYIISHKPIHSVGGKANMNSADMAKYDLNDPEDVKRALEAYKGLAD